MTCPSCDAPRPRGAKRCVCGFVFEFETATALAEERPQKSAATPASLAGAGAVAAALVLLLYHGPARTGDGSLVGGLLCLLVGVFCVAGAACDWDFFMENRRARLFVALLGRGGARWFYALLGGAIAGLGFRFF